MVYFESVFNLLYIKFFSRFLGIKTQHVQFAAKLEHSQTHPRLETREPT